MGSNNKPFSDQINILIDENKSAAFIARAINVSDTTVRKWRDGASDPSRESLIKLSEELDVSLLWLATGQGPKKRSIHEYSETQAPDIGKVEDNAKPYSAKTMGDIGESLRLSRIKFEQAVKATGYEPDIIIAEHIKSMIFEASTRGEVTLNQVINLLDALKPD